MSKMGTYVIGMQEDALELSEFEFCKKYGVSNLHVWQYMNEAYK